MCAVCGTYKEKQVIDINAKIEKKTEKQKAKLKALGKDPNEKQIKEDSPKLDPKSLSQKQ